MIFRPVNTSKLGVFNNENYRIVSCMDGHIELSFAQKGKAMTIHFAADKGGLRHIKPAIAEFCEMILMRYTEIIYIYAATSKKRPSLQRLANKLGFSYLVDDAQHHIYVRSR